MSEKIKIVLVDDEELFRKGISFLLQRETNIDVVFEEISTEKLSEDDFVITPVQAEIDETPTVEEEKQIEFTFDMPLSAKPKKRIIDEPEIAINSIEVVDHKVIEPEKKVEEDVYFTLEDYTELEENLTKATKPVVKIDTEIEKIIINENCCFKIWWYLCSRF